MSTQNYVSLFFKIAFNFLLLPTLQFSNRYSSCIKKFVTKMIDDI